MTASAKQSDRCPDCGATYRVHNYDADGNALDCLALDDGSRALTLDERRTIVAEECAVLRGLVEVPVIDDAGSLTDGDYSEESATTESALRAQCKHWVSEVVGTPPAGNDR